MRKNLPYGQSEIMAGAAPHGGEYISVEEATHRALALSKAARERDAALAAANPGRPARVTRPTVEYTILLGQRPNANPPINRGEADAMDRLGFRFSVFNPATGVYRLSLPFTELVNLDKGTLTFRQ